MKREFSALLLAGGASSRMGMPKALVLVGGSPLWRRQVKVLQELEPAELMISAGRDWVPDKGPWILLRDRTPGLGPLEGIGSALAAMTTDLLLVLAIDMPSMSAAFLGGMVDVSGRQGTVPILDGTYQGLAGVYPRSCLALLDDVLREADHSMQHFVRRAIQGHLVAERPVSGSEESLFMNVNRPDDLQGLVQA